MSEPSVAAMAAEVQKKFGRCDIVINSAGIFPQLAFDQMKFADWRRVQQEHMELVRSAFGPVPILTAPYFPREVIGHAAATPPRAPRKLRRFICLTQFRETTPPPAAAGGYPGSRR